MEQLAQRLAELEQLLAQLVSDPRQVASDPAPRIELLVIQPTPFCNIDCRYCYLPNRNSKAVVSQQTLVNLFSQVFTSGWVGDDLSVVWHAGEPMVLPIRFYREAFQTIDQLKPAGLAVTHAFQTNGTMIDEAWCAFFAEERVNVGVSIDGPRHLHDCNRLTRSGHGTFDRTIGGIRLLRLMAVPFHVISVLSSSSMASPGDMFDFYLSEGIEQVCFNVEESEGAHVSRCFAEAGIESAYYRFLSEFWRLSARAPGRITFVREIEHAVRQVIRPKDAPFANQLVEPFAITSMDWAGNISTFSPELLGLKNADYGDFLLGNVNRDTLVDLLDRPNLGRMLGDIRAGVEMCRESCEYFSVCGGGEPVNKLAENGSFASTETTYCRLTKMRATDLVLDAIERVQQNRSDENGSGVDDMELATQAVREGAQPCACGPSFRRVTMNTTLPTLAAFAVGAAMQASLIGSAFAQGSPSASAPGGASPPYAGAGSKQQGGPAAPSDSVSPRDLPVLYVTKVEVLRTSIEPKLDIVQVTGQAASRSWSAPQLVPTYAGKAFDDVLDLELIATPPDQSENADGFVPVAAIFALEQDHPFKGVRVRGSQNAIDLRQIPGSSQATLNVNDCKDCMGKRFASKGHAEAGQPGIIREEDLPKALRLIRPSDGIGDVEQDPNRLTLILDEEDTIVEAFWE